MVTFIEASKAIIYPHVRLGLAVVKHAVSELREENPVQALDALIFWLEDAPYWLDMLELCDPDDDQYLLKVVNS